MLLRTDTIRFLALTLALTTTTFILQAQGAPIDADDSGTEVFYTRPAYTDIIRNYTTTTTTTTESEAATINESERERAQQQRQQQQHSNVIIDNEVENEAGLLMRSALAQAAASAASAAATATTEAVKDVQQQFNIAVEKATKALASDETDDNEIFQKAYKKVQNIVEEIKTSKDSEESDDAEEEEDEDDEIEAVRPVFGNAFSVVTEESDNVAKEEEEESNELTAAHNEVTAATPKVEPSPLTIGQQEEATTVKQTEESTTPVPTVNAQEIQAKVLEVTKEIAQDIIVASKPSEVTETPIQTSTTEAAKTGLEAEVVKLVGEAVTGAVKLASALDNITPEQIPSKAEEQIAAITPTITVETQESNQESVAKVVSKAIEQAAETITERLNLTQATAKEIPQQTSVDTDDIKAAITPTITIETSGANEETLAMIVSKAIKQSADAITQGEDLIPATEKVVVETEDIKAAIIPTITIETSKTNEDTLGAIVSKAIENAAATVKEGLNLTPTDEKLSTESSSDNTETAIKAAITPTITIETSGANDENLTAAVSKAIEQATEKVTEAVNLAVNKFSAEQSQANEEEKSKAIIIPTITIETSEKNEKTLGELVAKAITQVVTLSNQSQEPNLEAAKPTGNENQQQTLSLDEIIAVTATQEASEAPVRTDFDSLVVSKATEPFVAKDVETSTETRTDSASFSLSGITEEPAVRKQPEATTQDAPKALLAVVNQGTTENDGSGILEPRLDLEPTTEEIKEASVESDTNTARQAAPEQPAIAEVASTMPTPVEQQEATTTTTSTTTTTTELPIMAIIIDSEPLDLSMPEVVQETEQAPTMPALLPSDDSIVPTTLRPQDAVAAFILEATTLGRNLFAATKSSNTEEPAKEVLMTVNEDSKTDLSAINKPKTITAEVPSELSTTTTVRPSFFLGESSQTDVTDSAVSTSLPTESTTMTTTTSQTLPLADAAVTITPLPTATDLATTTAPAIDSTAATTIRVLESSSARSEAIPSFVIYEVSSSSSNSAQGSITTSSTAEASAISNDEQTIPNFVQSQPTFTAMPVTTIPDVRSATELETIEATTTVPSDGLTIKEAAAIESALDNIEATINQAIGEYKPSIIVATMSTEIPETTTTADSTEQVFNEEFAQNQAKVEATSSSAWATETTMRNELSAVTTTIAPSTTESVTESTKTNAEASIPSTTTTAATIKVEDAAAVLEALENLEASLRETLHMEGRKAGKETADVEEAKNESVTSTTTSTTTTTTTTTEAPATTTELPSTTESFVASSTSTTAEPTTESVAIVETFVTKTVSEESQQQPRNFANEELRVLTQQEGEQQRNMDQGEGLQQQQQQSTSFASGELRAVDFQQNVQLEPVIVQSSSEASTPTTITTELPPITTTTTTTEVPHTRTEAPTPSTTTEPTLETSSSVSELASSVENSWNGEASSSGATTTTSSTTTTTTTTSEATPLAAFTEAPATVPENSAAPSVSESLSPVTAVEPESQPESAPETTTLLPESDDSLTTTTTEVPTLLPFLLGLPQARALRPTTPAHIELLLNEDGVEVLYGYSTVQRN